MKPGFDLIDVAIFCSSMQELYVAPKFEDL
jgi:hypothetical protein